MKKVKKVLKKNINYKLVIKAEIIILAVLFILGLYQIYKYVPGVKEAVALATTVKPETFTELYFEDHLSLPNQIVYRKQNSFKFTIHNLEYKDMNYPYEVYIDVNGQKQMIDQSSVILKSDEYKTINEVFWISRPTVRIKVVTNLVDKNQLIDFWMENI